MSSFFSLNIALSGLRAQQYAMDVTGQNIANADTEGYVRQDVVFTTMSPTNVVAAQTPEGAVYLGTGVTVAAVRRLQSDYVNTQYRDEVGLSAMWDERYTALSEVESLYPEPGDSGLASVMDTFWNSWEDLSASPESESARISVTEAGTALADRIKEIYSGLRSLQSEMSTSIEDTVTDINDLADQIATLNVQIAKASAAGAEPNDLLTKRDGLVNDLSELIDIDAQEDSSTGSMIISIGGKTLVQDDHVTEMEVVTEEGAGTLSQVVWADNGDSVSVDGGKLKAYMDIRDDDIEGFIGSMNTIASTIVDAVNSVHSTGTDLNGNTTGNFFVAGTDASNITLEQSILDDPTTVSAGAGGSAGDNSIADAISDLSDSVLVDGKSVTTLYSNLVSSIGSKVSTAESQSTTHESTVTEIATQKESISGVSLDEELTNLIMYQKSYSAAARLVTTMTDMLDVVLNMGA